MHRRAQPNYKIITQTEVRLLTVGISVKKNEAGSFVSPFLERVIKNIGEWLHESLPQLGLLADRSLLSAGVSEY